MEINKLDTRRAYELNEQEQAELFLMYATALAKDESFSIPTKLAYLRAAMYGRICDWADLLPDERMTVKDMFTEEFSDKYGDVDICNNSVDSMFPAFCGPIELTEEGIRTFKDVLDVHIEVLDRGNDGVKYYVVELDTEERGDDWEVAHNTLYNLFSCAAGYCSVEEYDRLFTCKD